MLGLKNFVRPNILKTKILHLSIVFLRAGSSMLLLPRLDQMLRDMLGRGEENKGLEGRGEELCSMLSHTMGVCLR